MKNLTFILLIIITAFACDDPLTTEIKDTNEEELDLKKIEIFENDEAEELSFVGYDSTGTRTEIDDFSNVIEVTGMQYSRKNRTFYKNIYDAKFFDKSKPFQMHGRTFGYFGKNIGDVFFNNHMANLRSNRIRGVVNNNFVDTTLGFKHHYSSHFSNSPVNNQLPYNSNVKVDMNMNMHMGGRKVSVEFPTPPLINGKAKLRINENSGNKELELNWQQNSENMEIIIGGLINKRLRPFFKVKNNDEGNITLPNSVVESIPFNKMDALMVTFIRKIVTKKRNIPRIKDVVCISQSIHNFRIDIE